MGVTKKILKEGNGVDKPAKGDEIFMNYRGCLYDSNNPSGHYMGTKFDSTEDRGEFKTKIGVGAVIRGIMHTAQVTRNAVSPNAENNVIRVILISPRSLRDTEAKSNQPLYAYRISRLFATQDRQLTIKLGDIENRGFPGLIPPNATLVL
ncbi:FKBP-type peptidyl-prolyl cis-trans isomerase [Emydomyces testavorans]|uniref:peptidylprolyl isomerase n=1 Tax=Emydomyces testavorans TaxID=2070801 RepID=A0AAF0IK50_9EURO|nr:FKBP-type peptidyl-prolyl cis-trans isomerase [Emydomyces testavorans]